MDDLESRLSDELRSAGATVDASSGLDRAVRRRVRRRQTVAGAVAVLPVALLAVGALWVLDTSDDAADVDTFQPAPTTLVAPPTDPPAAPIDDPLRRALDDLGAAVDTAPERAVVLGEDQWCGVDRADGVDSSIAPPEPGRCIVDATDDGRAAALVRVVPTIEGDPIVMVARTTGAGDAVEVYIDSSQDSFGRPGWTTLDCTRAVTEPGDPTHPFGWENCAESGETAPDVIASIAPGEATEVQWPGQQFFPPAADSVDLFLLGEQNPDGTRLWAAAGSAVRNRDGTSTLTLVGPRTSGALDAAFDFAPASFQPVVPQSYELAAGLGSGGTVLGIEGRPVLVEITEGASSDWEPEELPVDPATAILAGTGVAGVSWGTAADDALVRLVETFGPVVTDEVVASCLTERVVDFAGITVWFAMETESGLVEDPDAAGLAGYRYHADATDVFTTLDGLRLGSHLGEVQQVGGAANGPYDGGWGATGWFLDDRLGGTLTRDMTDPNSRIATISAGATGNPARMVC